MSVPSAVEAGPCAGSETIERGLAPCAFILFGATGDLTRRKIIPALFSMHRQGLLPDPFVVVAFARRDGNDDSFREDIHDAAHEFVPDLAADEENWARFAEKVYYVRSTLDDVEGYRRLGERLADLDARYSLGGNRLFYLATPPDNFEEIVRNLGAAGLNRATAGSWARLIIEKPFGYDLTSARKLNADLQAVFEENQVYRIDHYLGKETVQNILVLRFANQIFEPLWNQRYIDNVQITVSETLGMEGRGAYFDRSGMTRDMVQNHALQVLMLIGMEAPVALDANSIRDEKVKVLRSIRPFTPQDVADFTVRGQYGPGAAAAGGREEQVVGYRQEPGVDPASTTETFAAFRFALDNWRWAGVPFYVQAGKRLPKRATEVQVQFKAVPEVLFARLQCSDIRPNRLTIRIQPDEGASLEISSKSPGPEMNVQPVRMNFQYGASFDAPIRDAYERLLLDAIRGEASLFARDDEVEAAWALMTPILDAWRDLSCPLFPNYAAGSWGPESANKLLSEGIAWHKPG